MFEKLCLPDSAEEAASKLWDILIRQGVIKKPQLKGNHEAIKSAWKGERKIGE